MGPAATVAARAQIGALSMVYRSPGAIRLPVSPEIAASRAPLVPGAFPSPSNRTYPPSGRHATRQRVPCRSSRDQDLGAEAQREDLRLDPAYSPDNVMTVFMHRCHNAERDEECAYRVKDVAEIRYQVEHMGSCPCRSAP